MEDLEKRPVGRPPSDNPLIVSYQIRTRFGEKDRWKETARIVGMDLPAFIRSTLRKECDRVEEEQKEKELRKQEKAMRKAKLQLMKEYGIQIPDEEQEETKEEPEPEKKSRGLPKPRNHTAV